MPILQLLKEEIRYLIHTVGEMNKQFPLKCSALDSKDILHPIPGDSSPSDADLLADLERRCFFFLERLRDSSSSSDSCDRYTLDGWMQLMDHVLFKFSSMLPRFLLYYLLISRCENLKSICQIFQLLISNSSYNKMKYTIDPEER